MSIIILVNNTILQPNTDESHRDFGGLASADEVYVPGHHWGSEWELCST
jgi:hypothetical protein